MYLGRFGRWTGSPLNCFTLEGLSLGKSLMAVLSRLAWRRCYFVDLLTGQSREAPLKRHQRLDWHVNQRTEGLLSVLVSEMEQVGERRFK